MIKENKIIIYGSFLDSYIYCNNLFLLNSDLTLKSYTWDSLVRSGITDENDALAYQCAFYQSDYLYGIGAQDLFYDGEIKALIEQKFNRINDLVFRAQDIEGFSSTGKPIVLSEFTTDMGIYNNKLFYCNSSGVFSRKLRKYDDVLISPKEVRLWDCPAQCLKIGSRGRIALSASSDGLYEINDFEYVPRGLETVDRYGGRNILKLSSDHSSYCSWSFSSLFTGSYIDKFELLGFKSVLKNEEEHPYLYQNYILNYQGNFSEHDIFSDEKSNSLIFAGNEKLYRIYDKSLDVVNYYQGNLGTEREVFQRLEKQNLPLDGEVVEAAVVEFGIVIETKKQLFVKLSTGRTVPINRGNEDVIRWRVFPRSNCYVNQLHVIYNDRIEIISFNEDYFVDQKRKTIGQRFDDRYFNK